MRLFLTLLAGATIGLAACDAASSAIPELGDGYALELQPAPLLDRDILRVRVSYSGGCQDHTFDLGYSTTGPEPELWLTHDANGDSCEAYITESLEIVVPQEALEGRPVRLYISETETIALMESFAR